MQARSRGFTLLELSIVLAIIGVVAAGSLVILTASTQTAQVNATVARLDAIDEALRKFAIVNTRLPCPSDATLTSTSNNYGVEAASNSNTCYGGTPSANRQAASSGAVEGGVPTRALQLPDDFMFDGWGRRIRYAVDPSKTATASFPAGANCTSTKAISVTDASGVSGKRSSNAVYALISSGANGHGAYTKNGVVFNAGSTNTDEQTNCHCDSSAAAANPYTPTYVQKLAVQSTASALASFDDLVSFKEGWQLQGPSFVAGTACAGGTEYIYVSDTGNNRVLKFGLDGSFIMAYGAGYNGIAGAKGANTCVNGQFTPGQVRLDSDGNMWVTDWGCNRIEKINPTTGAWIGQLGCASGSCSPSASDGGLDGVNGFDFEGAYIWVADYYTNRVEKFNRSTLAYADKMNLGYYPTFVAANNSYIFIFSNNLMTLYQRTLAGSAVTNTPGAGSGDGYFSSTSVNASNFMTVDASGNLWAVDECNYRVQKFNGTTLAFMTKIAGQPSNSPACNSLTGVAFDISGNVYMSNEYDNRIYKYNSAGTAVNSYGGGTVNYFDPTTIVGDLPVTYGLNGIHISSYR